MIHVLKETLQSSVLRKAWFIIEDEVKISQMILKDMLGTETKNKAKAWAYMAGQDHNTHQWELEQGTGA